MKSYKIVSARNVYGGSVYIIDFDDPPTKEELNEVVNHIDRPYFGYGLLAGTCGEDIRFQVKVYND